MPVSIGLMPRARSSTAAAPISPNTAPDAPTVERVGRDDQRAERAGEQRDEVDRGEAHRADRRLEHFPSRYSRYMLKKMCSRPACRKPLVTMPPVVAVGDVRAEERELVEDRVPPLPVRPDAELPLGQEHDHVDRDQHVGDDRLVRRAAQRPTFVRWLEHSGQRMPTGRRRHAVGADRRGRSSSSERRSRGSGGGSRSPPAARYTAAVMTGAPVGFDRAALRLAGDHDRVDALDRPDVDAAAAVHHGEQRPRGLRAPSLRAPDPHLVDVAARRVAHAADLEPRMVAGHANRCARAGHRDVRLDRAGRIPGHAAPDRHADGERRGDQPGNRQGPQEPAPAPRGAARRRRAALIASDSTTPMIRSLSVRRRRDLLGGERQRVGRDLQPRDLRAAVLAAAQMLLEGGRLALVQRAEHPGARVDPVVAAAHVHASARPPSWPRIFSSPSRIRPFTVPIGVSSISAISDWLKPPK